ncbi:MAG: GspE/PulE family protein [Proteobacteria bacterium]|nr:GspE/PulE family protein [Pseudomonadota bacterium]
MRKKIGEILIEKGLLTEEQLKRGLEEAKKSREKVGNVLINLGYITEDDLYKSLAEQLKLPYDDLSQYIPPDKLPSGISVELMRKYQIVFIREEGGKYYFAFSDPIRVLTIDELYLILGKPIEIIVSPKSRIEKALAKLESASKILEEVTEDFRVLLIKETEQGEEVLSLEKLTEDTSPVVKLIDTAIYDALQKRASDIHIESSQEGVYVRFRIDGILQKILGPIDLKYQSHIISRIKVMSDLDIAEQRIPQDGRFKLKIRGKYVDFRVSIVPTIFGEDAVIRVLDKESIMIDLKNLRLDYLGFDNDLVEAFRKKIREPYGMVLVTGPTGSGKTTTLYAAISEINSGEDKIVTIEDPVEYQLKGVVQIPVNEKKGLTFARGLRSILRHDPDKIMVGEIRDPETAQIAIQSALTGHLVFTTVHANNIFDVIARFLNMGISPYNFVSSLNCVLAQRLIRALCQNCKRAVNYVPDFLRLSGIDDKYKDYVFYEGEGCSECSYTGYKGRIAIGELLVLNDDIKELIIEKAPIQILKKKAKELGTVFLRESALKRVFEGVTTLKEINRVTFVE